MFRIPLTMAAIALAAPAFAQTMPSATSTTTAPTATAPAATGQAATAAAPTTAAAKPNVVAGAQVVDTTGAAVGSIEAVTNGIATLSTGTTKAGIPIGSFAANGDKLVLGMTKAQVDAQGAPAASTTTTAAASAAPAATTGAATTTTASAAPSITVGATVNDASGAKVGTVKAVNGDMVTVASDTASAQLPKKAFAASGDALVIGLTAAQFESAAKAAGGAKKG